MKPLDNLPYVRYKDWPFRIIVAFVGSHVVLTTGVHIPFWKIITLEQYWRLQSISTLMAFILVTSVWAVTKWLDRRVDWTDHFMKRLYWQTGLGVGLIGLLELMMADAYFLHFKQKHVYEIPEFFYHDLGLILIMLALLNSYYYGLYTRKIRRLEQPTKQRQEITPTSSDNTIVLKNNKGEHIRIVTDHICYVFQKGEDTFFTLHGQNDPVNVQSTLKEVRQSLDNRRYFQVNRHTIVNYQSIAEVLREGKHIRLRLSPETLEPVLVSRRSNRSFNQWIKDGQALD